MKILVLKEIARITDVLLDKEIPHPSLFSGFCGEALFFSELARFTKEKKYELHTKKLLEKAFTSFSEQPLPSSLCGGFTGIAALLIHLKQYHNFFTDDYRELNEINEYIHLFALDNFSKGNWDYLHGGLGAMFYFVNHPLWFNYTNYLEQYIDCMVDLSIPAEPGYKWRMLSLPGDETSNPKYNISLAHGASSIVSLLLKCYKKNIQPEKCKYIIYKAIEFIFFTKLGFSSKKDLLLFSRQNAEYNIPVSSLAWCKGDLSISSVLLSVGELLQNTSIQELAMALASATTSHNQKMEGCLDTCFCHGTIGIAYIYKRLYRQTNQSIFYDRMNYWLQETLSIRSLSAQNEYLFYGKAGYSYDHSLLNGLAGVGLAMLGCITEHDTKWDKMFLLS